MEKFFGDNVLLRTETARRLYDGVKNLPIVDIHCHLDRKMIAGDARFSDIGELWLAGDHYKWRAMRLLGIDEKYITGDADYKTKFITYASIVPKLVGNPLYYWTHFELKQIFGIDEPLNAQSAERIYNAANAKLKNLSVRKLLELFNVQYIATTDDPIDNLDDCGVYGKATVSPTFRPDNLFAQSEEYITKLASASGIKIKNLDGLLAALENRLDYFVAHGCKMSDHGIATFPHTYPDKKTAAELFARRDGLSASERDALNGYLNVWLAGEYAKRGITMQIHFAVKRNVNTAMFKRCGRDSGFDIVGECASVDDLVSFLDAIEHRPNIVLYTLNVANLSAIATATGAFDRVRMGAAWWFNDTLEGIKHNLATIAEYSVLGNNLGMLTDSRSFSSYSRFDFFRRILCDYIGEKAELGEYDINAAIDIVKDICYNNSADIVLK